MVHLSERITERALSSYSPVLQQAHLSFSLPPHPGEKGSDRILGRGPSPDVIRIILCYLPVELGHVATSD